MILSFKHRFVFLKGRKVGGTSVEIALARVCGPDDVITPITPVDEALRLDAGRTCQNFHPDPKVERAFVACVREGRYKDALRTGAHNPRQARLVNHTSLQDVEQALTFDAAHFRKIVCERSPYAKVVSLANMKLSAKFYDGGPMINSPEKIREMIAKIMESGEHERLNNLPLYRTDRHYAEEIVLRTECLGEDIARLWGHLGLPGTPSLPFAKEGASRLGIPPEDMLTPAQIAEINRVFAEEFERYGYPRLKP